MADYSPIADALTQKSLTKAMIDSVILSIHANPKPPSVIVASPFVYAIFGVSRTAEIEQWNWRRTKRELRRIGLVRQGVRRAYHKRAA